jgi:hypothetical protein
MRLPKLGRPPLTCWKCGTTGSYRNPVKMTLTVPPSSGGRDEPSNRQPLCLLDWQAQTTLAPLVGWR